jgi:hypothetical protein
MSKTFCNFKENLSLEIAITFKLLSEVTNRNAKLLIISFFYKMLR